jgi:RNA-binding protein 25
MAEYLGELEDDDLVNFVLEQLRDKKGPDDIVDGLEPVSGLVALSTSG